MRILAFSDLHRNGDLAREILRASEDADVVIGAGDFATKGIGHEDTLSVLKELAAPTVFVAGNHDVLASLRASFDDRANIHVLHGEAVRIGQIDFFGLGFEIPAGADEPWNQRMEEADAAVHLKKCPPRAVLVTHSPPYGVADIQRDGTHVGSRTIRDAVRDSAPRLHLCGHIHHAWGTCGIIGNCSVHNLGPSLNWFTVT
ncbi:metallophosphoesterase family protein [Bradyrhizobium iriomotense]|uniref:metallophosphoesterase family protein n=1 Tax=Bradyrhizobium iriomotense TaxID=441950 RepID=UPI001B8A2022|nr:metallophosphoesterase [Bradyrhizobium iriomotense]MBR0780300.1 metallophosphoesterase family protein [Bradyrhizobium iriomotense]